MTAAIDPKLTWYVARASGLVVWLLCAAAIVWGLGLSTRLVRRRGMPAWLSDLHTFLGTMALVFCGIHIGALALDRHTPFGWADLFVPMASTWRPLPVAWGIVAFYLLLAIQLTSWARRRLSRRVWHAVHLSSVGLFITGTIHGITAGADWSSQLVRWGALAVSALVVLTGGMRVGARRAVAGKERRRPQPSGVTTAAGGTP